MRKVKFSREVVVNRCYEVSVDEFMNNYFDSAEEHWTKPGMVLIFAVGAKEGYRTWVFDVENKERLDISKRSNVKKLIEDKFEVGGGEDE